MLSMCGVVLLVVVVGVTVVLGRLLVGVLGVVGGGRALSSVFRLLMSRSVILVLSVMALLLVLVCPGVVLQTGRFWLLRTWVTNYGLMRQLLPVNIVQLWVTDSGAIESALSVSERPLGKDGTGKLKCATRLCEKVMLVVLSSCIDIRPCDWITVLCSCTGFTKALLLPSGC